MELTVAQKQVEQKAVTLHDKLVEAVQAPIDTSLDAADLKPVIAAHMQRVGDYTLLAQKGEKEGLAIFNPAKDALNKAKAELMAVIKKATAPFIAAKTMGKKRLAELQEMLDECDAELQRRADEDARNRAEEQQLRDAAGLEAAGMSAEAESILETPVVASGDKVEKTKVDGISTRKNYKAEVVDLSTLVKAVNDGTAPAGCLIADQKVLNGMAKALKENLAIPGVKLVVETVVVGRTG